MLLFMSATYISIYIYICVYINIIIQLTMQIIYIYIYCFGALRGLGLVAIEGLLGAWDLVVECFGVWQVDP